MLLNISALVVMLILSVCLGDMVYPSDPSKDFSNRTYLKSYSLNLMNYKFNVSNIGVLDLQSEPSFDWCDSNNFRPRSLLPMIQKFNLGNIKNLTWAAYIPDLSLKRCPNKVTPSSAWIWSNIGVIAYLINEAGGNGVIIGRAPNSFTPPILQYLSRSGTPGILDSLNTPFIVLLNRDEAPIFEKDLAFYQSLKFPMFLSSMTDTFNSNDIFIQPLGALYYIVRITNGGALVYSLVSLYKVLTFIFKRANQGRFHNKYNKGNSLLGTSLSILILSNVCRCLYFVDPQGFYGIFSYNFIIIIASLSNSTVGIFLIFLLR